MPPSQKVPFEIICLADAVRSAHVNRAYLVLGGDGWTLRDYYTSGALADHLIHAALVRVVTLEAFHSSREQRATVIRVDERMLPDAVLGLAFDRARACDRHAQLDRLLSLAHVTAKLAPTVEALQRPSGIPRVSHWIIARI